MATSAPKTAPKAEAATEAPAPKKSGKKMIMLVAIAALLVGGGGGAAWYFLGNKAEPGAVKHAKVEPAKPPVFLLMEPFVVNLLSDGTDQFLQCTFTMQVPNSEQVDLLKLYMPQVRSRLLLLLTSKHATDLNTGEGKKKLITEIKAATNLPFTPGGKPQEVSDVFFTSFVIQ